MKHAGQYCIQDLVDDDDDEEPEEEYTFPEHRGTSRSDGTLSTSGASLEIPSLVVSHSGPRLELHTLKNIVTHNLARQMKLLTPFWLSQAKIDNNVRMLSLRLNC